MKTIFTLFAIAGVIVLVAPFIKSDFDDQDGPRSA
jgi:hypothetical protein